MECRGQDQQQSCNTVFLALLSLDPKASDDEQVRHHTDQSSEIQGSASEAWEKQPSDDRTHESNATLTELDIEGDGG